MVNGLWCDLLLRPLVRSKNRGHGPRLDAISSILITACCIAAAVVYGQFRLNQGQRTITPGPTIAVVQEAIPQYVKVSSDSDRKSREEIFRKHLKLSQEALAANVEPNLIVWPETMVSGPLNHEFLNLQTDVLTEEGQELLKESLSYDSRLRDLSRKGTAVLVGSTSFTLFDDPMKKYNSAFLYLDDGQRYHTRYDKMHLVPFGEVVPFRESWHWLYRLLNNLTPYDQEYTLDAGKNPTVFEFGDKNGKKWRFAVAICYEDVMPQVPRRLAAAEKGNKRVDFLLNISNDGWFVTGGQGTPLNPSAELLQHLVICKFRAVENRVGIVRAVNTGISAFIRPDGRVQEGYLAGNLSKNHTQRQAEAGFLTDNVYLDRRISPYSIIGDSFAIACTVLTGFLFIGGILMQSRWKKKAKSIR